MIFDVEFEMLVHFSGRLFHIAAAPPALVVFCRFFFY